MKTEFLGNIRSALSSENVPVIRLVWVVLKKILHLLTPLLLPVIGIILVIFLATVAKNLYAKKKAQEKTGFTGVLSAMLSSALSVGSTILRHLPTLLVLLVTLVGINSVLLLGNNIVKMVNDIKRIRELSVMVKNLSQVEDVARVTVLSKSGGPDSASIEKTYRIEILSETGESVSEQEVTLRGNRIAVDSIVINFDYSQIESGEQKNIAYPYRVYSEFMKPDNAIPLTCMFNGEGLPVIYCLSSEHIYGLSGNSFFERLKEFFGILKDDELSREMGIRSANGTLNHFTAEPGEVYIISIEATGGLTVHKKVNLG